MHTFRCWFLLPPASIQPIPPPPCCAAALQVNKLTCCPISSMLFISAATLSGLLWLCSGRRMAASGSSLTCRSPLQSGRSFKSQPNFLAAASKSTLAGSTRSGALAGAVAEAGAGVWEVPEVVGSALARTDITRAGTLPPMLRGLLIAGREGLIQEVESGMPAPSPALQMLEWIAGADVKAVKSVFSGWKWGWKGRVWANIWPAALLQAPQTTWALHASRRLIWQFCWLRSG